MIMLAPIRGEKPYYQSKKNTNDYAKLYIKMKKTK